MDQCTSLWYVQPTLALEFLTLCIADWIDFSVDFPMLVIANIKALVVTSEIFNALGNTGTGHWFLWCTTSDQINAEKSLRVEQDPDYQRTKVKTKDHYMSCQQRHPDPALVDKLQIQSVNLQVEGSWLKMKNSGVMARSDFASFVWKSMSILHNLCSLTLFRSTVHHWREEVQFSEDAEGTEVPGSRRDVVYRPRDFRLLAFRTKLSPAGATVYGLADSHSS